MPNVLQILLDEIKKLPHADLILVFGSAAKNEKAPADLDIALNATDCNNWAEAYKKYFETIAPLLVMARRRYGHLDPFVMTKTGLFVRDDSAWNWQEARNGKSLIRAICADGIPLDKVRFSD
jgi:hypothetical protein